MKSTSFALGALMASVAIAQPHRQHQAFHHKRGSEVVWVTDYDYVTETIDVTTTIWVSEGFVAPTSSAAPSSTSSSVTPVPAQFFEPAPSSPAQSTVPTTSSPSSVYVAPAPVSTYVAPTSAATPAYVAPIQSSTPVVASVSVPETPTPVVAPYVAPASSSTTPVAAPVASTSSSSSSGSSSSGGQCSEGSPCEGDITHYDAGLGACGWPNDGTTDKVVALPHVLMGTQSNGNPYCGKTITIMHNGKTTTAEVVDKCMGCDAFSIDLSDAAFMELADMGIGRTQATWFFN